MFISKITLNPVRQKTREMVINPRITHAMIEKSFPDTGTRKLWRLETSHRDPELYILSDAMPSPEHIVEQAGRQNDETGVVIKDYSRVLYAIENDAVFRMVSIVNPTRQILKKIVPLKGQSQVTEWLFRKSEENGFSIVSDIDISKAKEIIINKDKNRITIASCQIDLTVKITDAEKFKNMMVNGLGRSKAYGFGLVTISRV